jgi:hypothetical protein
MKARTLIVLGAILAMGIIVGCSNSSRTTAPIDTAQAFNLPNGADINRFDTDQATPTIQSVNPPEWAEVIGIYAHDKYGCHSLQLDKITFIELNFVRSIPANLTNGTEIKVKGSYSSLPGGRCQYSRTYNVESFQVVRHSDGTGQ